MSPFLKLVQYATLALDIGDSTINKELCIEGCDYETNALNSYSKIPPCKHNQCGSKELCNWRSSETPLNRKNNPKEDQKCMQKEKKQHSVFAATHIYNRSTSQILTPPIIQTSLLKCNISGGNA